MPLDLTGVGIYCSVAKDYTELVEAVTNPVQAIGTMPYGKVPHGKAGFAGQPAIPFHVPARAWRMAERAVREALAMSALGAADLTRFGVIVTTCWGDIEDVESQYAALKTTSKSATAPLSRKARGALAGYPLGSIANRIARRFGLHGPIVTISNACASGNIACSVAQELIEQGDARGMLVVGAERFTLTGVWGAERSGFVGRSLRPFDAQRAGTVLGEGAAAILLERDGRQRALASLRGSAMSCEDGADIILFKEDGQAFTTAMQDALAAGGLAPSEVDLISTHSPGTPLIDLLETRAIGRLLRGTAKHVGVNAFKSMTGHMSGASAVAEIVACVAQMRAGIVHGNAALTVPDPALGCSVMPAQSLERTVSIALSNACGSGGINTSVALATCRPRKSIDTADKTECAVAITAVEAVQAPAEATDWFESDAWFDRSEGVWEMNRSGQVGAIAGIMAARASGLFDGDPAIGRDTAILSGSWIAGAPFATEAFCEGLSKQPPLFLPSMAFNNGSHLGSIILARRLGLIGFATNYCGHLASGLQALIAAGRLIRRRAVRAALALSYDVEHPRLAEIARRLPKIDLAGLRDGAGALLCEARESALDRGAPVLGLLRGGRDFGDRLGLADEGLNAVLRKLGPLLSGDIGTIIVASPGGAGLRALAARIASGKDSCSICDTREVHSGAAQFAVALRSVLPICRPVLVLVGEDHGAKAAVRIEPL
ncbi:beta-ketoacyl synthase N-terminal-like domain-containing protein [Sphingomonas sp. DG1-23]|uniref:beta-ketoacyl synthase N-terminal-like domain-containing protein n=1 Tax=Sphingomonas sp. DG1-23 TaxID=3068316 RepID=UPI00273D7C8B|nr:beta-ketoacyl synthase N-terminal-like domain-containing protein [Sphingomonas sp. DG1-23]MDP5278692.1 beta-ketoacyl synthase N-terminal-like domain-containing protein [Sphingomonas sp. DG1-23]